MTTWPRVPVRARTARFAASVALAFLLTSTPAAAAPSPLRIAFGQVPCPSHERIAADIRSLLADVLGPASPSQAGPLYLSLDLISDTELLVELERTGSVPLQRVLPFARSDCSALAHSTTLLVRSWLSRPWRAMASAYTATHAKSEPQSRAAEYAPSELDAVAAPAAARWRAVLLAGGFSAGRSDLLGATANASLEWDAAPRWGIGLSAGIDGQVNGPQLSGGHVSVQHFRFALQGRLGFELGASSHLDLLAGPSIDLLLARGEGFPATSSELLPDVGGVLAARWRQRLTPRLEASAAIELSARLRRETFVMEPLGEAFALPAGRVAALAGLAWKID